MLKQSLAALGLIALSACQPEGQLASSAPDRTVGVGFGGGTLNSRRGGTPIGYAVGVFEEGGSYVVCAAINNADEAIEMQAVRALDVTANGQILVNGLGWAPRYNVANLNGSRASCRQTAVAVIPGAKIDVELSRNRFRG